MMRLRWLWLLLLCIGVLWLFPVPVSAQTGTGDRVILGQSYVLPSGHRLRGSLIVLGGSAKLEEDSLVDGDVTVVGGSLSAAGRVNGDVAVFGGSLSLLDGAYVDGDVIAFGGHVKRAEGAVVTGDVMTGLGWEKSRPFAKRPGRVPEVPYAPAEVSGARVLVGALLRVVGAILLAALMGGLAVIVLALAPEATHRVGSAMLDAPVLSLLVGLVTLLLALSIALLLVITICLAPFAMLLVGVLVLVMLFGWVALGWLLGDRVLRALDVDRPHPLLAGVIGVPLLTLVTRLPCVGVILLLLGASTGLGAAVLTRLGAQRYEV
ncbi:MAG: polymer-forming cytoskeletal protein [Anaerolineae bacterium]|nr:polymer-forming cytoskeletal protein [Anaerolineae bacterium]